MKVFPAVFIFMACIANLLAKPFTEEQHKNFEIMVKECVAKEGATDSDVAEMVQHEMPTTATGKCFQSCMMEKVGIISGSKFSVDGSLAVAAESGQGDARMAITRAIAEECESITNSDRCELALDIINCSASVAAKYSVDPKAILD